MEKSGGGGGGAPTGCYKCGRPGHWSRDCPSSSYSASSNHDGNNNKPSSFPSSHKPSNLPQPYNKNFTPKPPQNPQKLPRTRPKLTPELLLSNDGLGYVLRHFPRGFRYRGPGHEVDDLGNLIELYTQWHSHLLPYFSFKQFVQKVEQVGATKRVRTCMRELRDRVARGGDPTKLHEPPVEPVYPNNEPGTEEEAMNVEGSMPDLDPSLGCHDADVMHEEMFDEIYRQAVTDTLQNQTVDSSGPEVPSEHNSAAEKSRIQTPENQANSSGIVQLTEEQKFRMEANRLKALEKAAARARSTVAT